MLERDLQRKCVKEARKRGFWASKFVAQGRRSAPDYIFAIKRTGYDWLMDFHPVFFVEFKRPGEEATELQKEFHETMREYGMHVYVCDNFETFIQVLERYA